MQDLSFDGSFLGDITDNVITHCVPGGTPANYFRYGKNEFHYIKIHVEKIGTTSFTLDSQGRKVSMAVWTDLMVDVLKGVFYLPSFGFHTGIIQSVSVSEDTEIVTKARYCIRPVYDEVVSLQTYLKTYKLSDSDNDLIHRFNMFSQLLRIKEPTIEMRKLSPFGTAPEKSFWIPTCRAKAGLIVPPGIPNGLSPFYGGQSPSEDVLEFIKPFRTPLLLKYKMENTLLNFFPERKTEIETWMNDVLEFLTVSVKTEHVSGLDLPAIPEIPAPTTPTRSKVGPSGPKLSEPVKEPVKVSKRNLATSLQTSLSNSKLPPIPEIKSL